jgi:hypothetical protein
MPSPRGDRIIGAIHESNTQHLAGATDDPQVRPILTGAVVAQVERCVSATLLGRQQLNQYFCP